jgi:hypothetical protein
MCLMININKEKESKYCYIKWHLTPGRILGQEQLTKNQNCSAYEVFF